MMVSVIIPCYNAAPFIEEALQSVVSQTLTSWELVVVDDGSTDDTASRVKAFSDARIRYFYKSNTGVADTRNFGITLAMGKYIAFLDADDLFLPQNLEKKVLFLEQHPLIPLVHAAETVFDSESGNIVNTSFGKSGTVLNDLLEMKGTVIHSPSSVVVRKEILADCGLFDVNLSTSADWELWVRLAARCEFGYLSEPLSRYRVHARQMHRNIALMEKDVMYALKKINKSGLFDSKRYFRFCKANFHLILAACYKGDARNYWQFFRHLALSVFLDPAPLLRKINFLKA